MARITTATYFAGAPDAHGRVEQVTVHSLNHTPGELIRLINVPGMHVRTGSYHLGTYRDAWTDSVRFDADVPQVPDVLNRNHVFMSDGELAVGFASGKRRVTRVG